MRWATTIKNGGRRGWRCPAAAARAAGRESHPPIRVHATIKPVKLSEPKPGLYVFDLGVNITGWRGFTIPERPVKR